MPDDPKLIAFSAGRWSLPATLAGMKECGTAWTRRSSTTPPDRHWCVPAHRFRLGEQGRPGDLTLTPFHALHHNRTAVYFRRVDTAEWEAAARERVAIEARTIDLIRLGEQQPEVDHALTAVGDTKTVPHMTDHSRIVNKGHFEFDLATAPGPAVLQVVHGGRQSDKDFRILIDGRLLARERLAGAATAARNVVDYPVSADAGRKPASGSRRTACMGWRSIRSA